MRLLLAAVVLAAAIFVVAPASSASQANLRIVARHPLTVVGSRFRPNERVTVTAIGAGKHVAAVRAGLGGRFRVRFRHVQVKRCLNYIVTARGALASFAIARVRSECASP